MTNYPAAAWVLLGAVTLLVLVLPFVPCWNEWRRPTDLAALVIARDEVNNVRYFADAFRKHVNEACAGAGPVMDTTVRILRASTPAEAFPWSAAQRAVMVDGSLHVSGTLACPSPVYAGGDAVLPSGAHLPALLCTGNAALGPETRISEWAHADGILSLGAGGVVLHRLTAGVALMLDKGSGFCRIHAPVIHFGISEDACATPLARPPGPPPPPDLSALTPCGPKRYRAKGDVLLPAGRYLEGTLLAGGTIRLAEDALVYGSVKAHRHVRLQRGAQVHGALVCGGDIEIGPDCWVGGPIVCEGDVRLASGSRIGTKAIPTTLAAARVLAETGAVAHGTVWARKAGVVTA
ncbi:bactofilin family protein [Massilia litorea]|uniref:Polymer-forming cytoskeletal protein n=1 Tax=Massilia litorea TaxID=2769491 RepID=A0A7L9TZM3_9BURK|nr:polymer-forming cytoskeletal protein [Massilia litorea]QOL48148.1 hypothetical protein LPB04_14215 [Massilia litorea]